MKKTLFFIIIFLIITFSKVNATEYIYFDLYYGNVTIIDGTYSGYGFNGATQSGTHKDSNNYYIFQSKGEKNLTSVPSYARIKYNSTTTWADFITNHPVKSTNADKADSVDDVIYAWGAVTELKTTNVDSNGVAVKAGRLPTPNYIAIKGSGTYNVVIDDVWSSHQEKIVAAQQETRNDLGGFTYIPTNINTTLNLFIEGDNRFGNIHAATHDGRNSVYEMDPTHTNKIVINELNEGTNATLTLCNLMIDSNVNDTSACIGGTDQWDHSVKMIFESGVIYAGSAKDDFCTAIGGGGNGDGIVIIKGGKITAVNSSTGTAIGGGCGTAGPGGYGNVQIDGGEVYAYSYKVSFGTNEIYNQALPTAIGGGSSGIQIGGTGIVTINGGKVYAYSETGNAIGGGGGGNGFSKNEYYSATGGIADVTINGGEIIAISGQGCAIGGGPGGGQLYANYANISKNNLPQDFLSIDENGNYTGRVDAGGGEATLTINNGTIKTGSIGGGSPLFAEGTDKNPYGFTIGAAKVYIYGGTTHGQIVMEGTGSIFEMNDGLIDNSYIGDEYNFVKNDGGAVFVKTGNATLNGGTIKNASANNGGAVYVEDGKFEMTNGSIEECTAIQNGGAIYLSGGNFIIEGGNIGRIEDNKKLGCKAIKGGAAYISGGNYTMNGGTIEGNTATESGGGIQISDGNVYITDGKISSNVARGDTNNAGYGGGIFVDGGEIVNMTGGEISSNVAAQNGGGIGIKTDKAVTIDISSGKFIENVAEKNGGAMAIECDNGIINLGEENCDGSEESLHDHPLLSENIAAVQGGGFYMSGAKAILNVYCGLIDNNIVGETENNFDQSDGTVTVYDGGKIGDANEGIIVVGGTFIDKREENEEKVLITYYSNYGGSLACKQALVTKGAFITVPGNIFDIEGYSIWGWNTDSNTSESVEYVTGEVIQITEETTIYGVWILEEENEPSFVIVIPAELIFDEKAESLTFDIEATLNLFTRDMMLNLNLENANMNLILYADEEERDSIPYKIKKGEDEIEVGDTVLSAYSDSALITYEVIEELELTLMGTPKYGGDYEDILTFSASVETL